MVPYFRILQRNIPSYGVFLAAAIVVAGALAYRRCRKANLSGDDFLILAVSAIGVGLVMAWGLYVAVTFSIRELVSIVQSGGIGMLFQGGMVFYGGAIGGFFGALLGARIAKVRLLDYVNPVVPCLPLAHAIGRLGCFSAGCCYGVPTDSCLGVVFQNPVGGAPAGVALFPVQLLESGLNLLLFAGLVILTKRTKVRAIALPAYLLGYGAVRFTTEFFRADAVRGFLWGLSTSQWISLLLIAGTGVYLLLLGRRHKNRAG